jgi:hypothetical protein
MCMLFVHILLGGAFPKRHRANCGVIAIIRKVPILGHHNNLCVVLADLVLVEDNLCVLLANLVLVAHNFDNHPSL